MTTEIANPTLLSGGPLGGTGVDQSDWPIGEERIFAHEDGDLIYRNDPGDHAVFLGHAPEN